MCSRARLRSVWMSERNAPLPITYVLSSLLLRRAAGRCPALGSGVPCLDVGLGLLVLGLGFLLAGALFLALGGVALLLRHLVLVLGFRLVNLPGMCRGRFEAVVELGLRHVLLALGVGFAHFLLVTFHRAALRLGGLVIGFHAIVLRLALLAVDARLARRRGRRLRLRGTGERQRDGGGHSDQLDLHRDLG